MLDDALAWRRARVALFGLTAAVYSVALATPFQFDDRGISGSLGGLRPVVKLTYAFCAWFGDGTFAFHLFNVIVHLVNVWLVLTLASLALRGSSRLGALVTATLFALHPVHTEAVTYISGRPSLLSTTFALLALLAHVYGTRTRHGGLVWGAAPLAFACAVLTKETTLVLPLGLLLWDKLVERAPPRTVIARQAPWWVAGAAVFAFMVSHDRYFALIYRVIGQRALRDAVVQQLGAIGYLAKALVLLRRPCIDPGLWARPTTAGLVLGIAVVVALIAIAVSQRTSRPVVTFGIAWFLLHAFLIYALVSRVDVINERHAYIADFGLFLVVGAMVAEWRPRRVRVTAAFAAALVVVLAVATVVRNREYESEVTLWKSTVREAPKNPRAWNNLGVAHERNYAPESAISAYVHALAAEPRYTPARENLARLTR